MAKNAFHTSKGIGVQRPLWLQTWPALLRLCRPFSSPFDSGARGAALTLVEFRVNASARYHFITTLTIAVINRLTAIVTKRIHATSRRNFIARASGVWPAQH
jgi:hypothetical protein